MGAPLAKALRELEEVLTGGLAALVVLVAPAAGLYPVGVEVVRGGLAGAGAPRGRPDPMGICSSSMSSSSYVDRPAVVIVRGHHQVM